MSGEPKVTGHSSTYLAKSAKLVGPDLGKALRMEWKKPVEMATQSGFASATTMMNLQLQERIKAADVPYHPMALAGAYHAFRIENKFPIPGGAIQDDKRRRSVSSPVKLLSTTPAATCDVKQLSNLAEAKADAAALAYKRENPLIKYSDFNELPVVKALQDAKDAVDVEILRSAAPKWPSLETYPLEGVELEIFDVIAQNDVDEMKRKMASRAVNLNGSDPITGHTGVMRCALLGREEMLKMYVDAGADLNKRADSGNTALHFVFEVPQPTTVEARKRTAQSINRMVRYLIENGAKVTLTNLRGETPLHKAAAANFGLAVKLMLEHGGNMHAPRADGQTPVDVARARNSKDALTIFVNWHSIARAQRIEPVARDILRLASLATSATHEERVAAELQQRFGLPKAAAGNPDGSGGSGSSPPKPGSDVDSMLTDIAVKPPFEVDEKAEKSIAAEDLVTRWHLLEHWIERRRDAGEVTVHPGASVPTVTLTGDGSGLQVVPAAAPGLVGRTVTQARMLTSGDTFGKGTRWLEPGQIGTTMLAHQKRQQREDLRRRFDDDGLSLQALSEDGEARPNSRVSTAQTTAPHRSRPGLSVVQEGDEIAETHNMTMKHIAQGSGALPGVSDTQLYPPREIDSLTVPLGTGQFGGFMTPGLGGHVPPPSRALKELPWAEEALGKTEGVHGPEREAWGKIDVAEGEMHPLMFPSKDIDRIKQIAMVSSATFRRKTYLKLSHVGSDPASPAPSTTMSERRRRVAAAIVEDTPGVTYNVKNTHIVDGQIMTRRPAIMSAALAPSRFRVDNRDLSVQTVATSTDPHILQQLIVGVMPDTSREEVERAAVAKLTPQRR